MLNLQWIKLSCELFTNRKIVYIRGLAHGDCYTLIWVYLLLLASRTSHDGRLIFAKGVPYTEERIASEGGFDEERVREAMLLFLKCNMISRAGAYYKIKNFLKYQSIEEYERVREQRNERARAFRKRERETVPALTDEEMEKLRLQISDENIEHYLSVLKRTSEKGKRPKSPYDFIVKMAKADKRLKIDENVGLNRSIENERERLKLPDAELSETELAFKLALKRSYGEGVI